MEERVKIIVKSTYLPNRSNPIRLYYLFSYKIKIINNSPITIKLLSRHWNIKDAEGRVEDIFVCRISKLSRFVKLPIISGTAPRRLV